MTPLTSTLRSTITGLALLLTSCGPGDEGRKYEARDCTTTQISCSDPGGCTASLCFDYSCADLCRALYNCNDLPASTQPVYDCNQNCQVPSDAVMNCVYDGQTQECSPGLLERCQEQEKT